MIILDSISWTHYLMVVLLLAAAYYLLIGICFYAHELKNFFAAGFKKRSASVGEYPATVTQAAAVQMELSFAGTSEDTSGQAEELINRLKVVIEEAVRQEYSKEVFNHSLSLILKQYAHLKDSLFESAIHELIHAECEKLGFLTLDEQEMKRLWG